jgi:hypothetical protein
MPTKRHVLTVNVGPLHEQIVAHCASVGLKPARWGLQVVEAAVKELGMDTPERATARTAPHRHPYADGVKFTAQLTKAESAALVKSAQAAGLSQAEYIGRLVTMPAAVTPTELRSALQALSQSNVQLAAIGRNVNQIAHALNAAPGALSEQERHVIQDTCRAIREHIDAARAVVDQLSITRRQAGHRRV